MKHKKLKQELLKVIEKKIIPTVIPEITDVNFLNDYEMDLTTGGSGVDCPKLNKKSCGSYGVDNCDINFRIKRKKKKD